MQDTESSSLQRSLMCPFMTTSPNSVNNQFRDSKGSFLLFDQEQIREDQEGTGRCITATLQARQDDSMVCPG